MQDNIILFMFHLFLSNDTVGRAAGTGGAYAPPALLLGGSGGHTTGGGHKVPFFLKAFLYKKGTFQL